MAAWKPGQSGNPNGRPRRKRALSDLLRTVGNLRDDPQGPQKKRLLAEKVWTMALAGDLDAIKLIYEYCDGKPVQRNELSGPDSGPIPLSFDYRDIVADLTDPETEPTGDRAPSGARETIGDGAAVGQDDAGRGDLAG